MKGSGLIVFGKRILVDGLNVINYEDDPRLKMGPEDGARRQTKWIRQVILHTTLGIPDSHSQRAQSISTEAPPPNAGDKKFDTAMFWSTSKTQSGAHLLVDSDGSVGQVADLGEIAMFHAAQRTVNSTSIGVEIRQATDSSINIRAIEAAVKLVDALTSIFGIQRQCHMPYRNNPIERLSRGGGKDCVGVFGHRDCSADRGFGDPGDLIMNELIYKNGYEKFDFSIEQDKTVWMNRQKQLKLTPDGVPGPGTLQRLKDEGYVNGIWAAGNSKIAMFPGPDMKVVVTPPMSTVKSNDVVVPVPDPNAWAKVLEFFKNLFASKS